MALICRNFESWTCGGFGRLVISLRNIIALVEGLLSRGNAGLLPRLHVAMALGRSFLVWND
jgi:hypothetical protein